MKKGQRVPINPSQKKRLLEKNAYACCVCKERGIGINFHHLDEDPSNNSDDNIAVLCVKEHDNHHRPKAYEHVNHLDLSTDELRRKKNSWESFVSEARKEHPKVLALVTAYGTEESIIGMKIVFQWVNGKIEFERKYQLLDAPMDILLDKMIGEVVWIGKNIKIHLINNAMPIEYCSNCNEGVMSKILDENMAIKETTIDWETESLCTIYINPQNPSLAYTIFYKGDVLYEASIHKCGNNLHFMDNKHEELYPLFKYKIRTQVVKLLVDKLNDWNIKSAIVGTGDSDNPNIVSKLYLPSIWEERKKSKHNVNKK